MYISDDVYGDDGEVIEHGKEIKRKIVPLHTHGVLIFSACAWLSDLFVVVALTSEQTDQLPGSRFRVKRTTFWHATT